MELRATLDESDANIASFTTMIVLSNIFMATTLLAIVWFLLNKFVSNPLKNMIEVVKSLASGDRDLTKRIPVNSGDDLGVLSNDFNNYLQSIEDNAKREKEFINEAKKV
jgi:methyl-accepting chemotaxis protein